MALSGAAGAGVHQVARGGAPDTERFRPAITTTMAGAQSLVQQAIALDSGFAMAYRTMGIYQRNAGMLKAALGSFSAALKRRDRLTDRERYLTLGDYHSLLFEPEQSIAAYRSLLESHPDDREALNNLGVLYLMLRRPGEAEPMFQQGNRGRLVFLAATHHAGHLSISRRKAFGGLFFLSTRDPAAPRRP